jgi:hypothetical protein
MEIMDQFEDDDDEELTRALEASVREFQGNQQQVRS